MKSQKIIIEICAALLILLFAYTGLSKLMEYEVFKIQLEASPWPLLARSASVVAWALPVTELLLMVLLLIPKTRLLGFWLSLGIMIFFTLYLSILLLSGVKLPCSCGGVIKYMPWKWHLLFNIAFVATAILGIIQTKRKGSSPFFHSNVQFESI